MLSYISYFPDRKRGFLEKQFLDELYFGSSDGSLCQEVLLVIEKEELRFIIIPSGTSLK